jgi:hypothetical protein
MWYYQLLLDEHILKILQAVSSSPWWWCIGLSVYADTEQNNTEKCRQNKSVIIELEQSRVVCALNWVAMLILLYIFNLLCVCSIVIYEGGSVMSQARSLWRLELARTKWAGGFINWYHPMRIRHLTTGRYLGVNENNELYLVRKYVISCKYMLIKWKSIKVIQNV